MPVTKLGNNPEIQTYIYEAEEQPSNANIPLTKLRNNPEIQTYNYEAEEQPSTANIPVTKLRNNPAPLAYADWGSERQPFSTILTKILVVFPSPSNQISGYYLIRPPHSFQLIIVIR
jgi:hypothetical protein